MCLLAKAQPRLDFYANAPRDVHTTNAASENVTGLWWNPGMEMFTIVLRGPFLFAASIGFVEGLDPTAYTGHLCHGAVGVKHVPTL